MSNRKSLKQRSINENIDISSQLINAFGGLSIKQIGEKLGYNPSSFWNWATGRTAMPKEVLAQVGKETGFSLNWILTKEGDQMTVEKKRFRDKELAELVNKRNWGLFTVEIFVYELAQINSEFRKMLDNDSYRRVEEVYRALQELMEAEEDYAEYIRKEMYDDINSRPELVAELLKKQKELKDEIAQDLGNVDEFNVEEAVQDYKTAAEILEAWYAFEGKPLPEGFQINFGGWEKLSTDDKIQTVKDVKKFADEMNEKIDRGELDDE